MNNRNKRLDRLWNVIIVLGLVFGIGISIFISMQLMDVPKTYNQQQDAEVKNIKDTISSSVAQNDTTRIEEMVKNQSVDLYIIDPETKKVFYSSIPEKAINDIDFATNNNAIMYQATYALTTDENSYDVWVAVYNVMPQDSFDYIIILIIKSALTLLAIIVLLLVILYIKFLLPLRELRNNIKKLSRFELEALRDNKSSGEFTVLSNEIYSFGQQLEVFINETGYKYTALESALQLQNEKLVYQNRLVASLTHNLKSPIVKSMHQIEVSKMDNKDKLVNNMKGVIDEINDISKIVYEDKTNEILEETEFDLIELVMSVYDAFADEFRSKKLMVEFDFDDSVYIKDRRIYYKEMVHNAISNIAKYAPDNANVTLYCYVEKNNLYLAFYNDAKPIDEKDLENVFKLFYRISDSNEGLGTGLFTIKTVAENLGGRISFSNKDDGVILEFYKEFNHEKNN